MSKFKIIANKQIFSVKSDSKLHDLYFSVDYEKRSFLLKLLQVKLHAGLITGIHLNWDIFNGGEDYFEQKFYGIGLGFTVLNITLRLNFTPIIYKLSNDPKPNL